MTKVKPLFRIAVRLTNIARQYFDVLPNGNILRLDQPGFESDRWKFVGLVERRGVFIPLGEITQEWKDKVEAGQGFLDKKRQPRYTVRDLDCGTVRDWGNGIVDIYFNLS